MLRVRHFLYDAGLIASRKGAIKTVVVGNLELGGTGKSQLVLLLIDLLKKEKPIALLSRGYGRSTTGYVEVRVDSNADQVGDEPLMFKRRSHEIAVAVCENRLAGIELLKINHPEVELVILDDAFQHRRLMPDLAVLTTSFSEPYFKNALVPAGGLRDIRSRAKKADVLVVTGAPKSESNDGWLSEADHHTDQVFFSSSDQGEAIPIGDEIAECASKVWLLSGIARPERFHKTVSKTRKVVGHTTMSDHHRFTNSELAEVRRKLDSFEPSEVSVLITEKDAARTDHNLLNTTFHPFRVFYLPLEMRMPRQDELKKKILKHVFGEDQGNI